MEPRETTLSPPGVELSGCKKCTILKYESARPPTNAGCIRASAQKCSNITFFTVFPLSDLRWPSAEPRLRRTATWSWIRSLEFIAPWGARAASLGGPLSCPGAEPRERREAPRGWARATLEAPGGSWEPPWEPPGSSWRPPGSSWGLLGAPGGLLGASLASWRPPGFLVK